MIHEQYKKSTVKASLQEATRQARSLREDGDKPKEVSAIDILMQKHGKDGDGTFNTVEEMLEELGIETEHDTFQGMVTAFDEDLKWLMPEIIWSRVRLGLRRAPIYPNIIAREEPVNGLRVQLPWINMSDATPRWVGEGETIQFGSVSYGSKEFKIRKMGRGIKVTDEVMRYSTINVVNIFFEDFGVKLGYGLDSVALDVLFNGEQADGSASAPVIGVDTVGTVTYRDLLRVWLQMGLMGKNPNTMVGGREIAMDILDLDEFKKSNRTAAPEARLNIQTPIPTQSNFYAHATIDEDQVVILDPRTAMIKFNAMPLKFESERIVSNQTEAAYASLTTGFATLFVDSRVILDKSVSYEDSPFPDYMNADALSIETIK